MTIEDLLGNSKLTPEEVSLNMEYKSIKNYITENIREANRFLMDTVMRLVQQLADDSLYSNVSGYCCSREDRVEIPSEDKKILLIAIYKKAIKNLDRMEKKVSGLADSIDDEAEEKEQPSAIEKVKEIVAPIAQAVAKQAPASDMFGY